jgi:hypothetical protein
MFVTDAKIAAVINHYQKATRWFHDGLCITTFELQELLDDRGLIDVLVHCPVVVVAQE